MRIADRVDKQINKAKSVAKRKNADKITGKV